jgi:uncharacterized protein YlzI (FlbEa/FlbD family)
MAEDARAIIVLTAGKPIRATESVEELRQRVAEAPEGDIAFMRVDATGGQTHWVNVHEIVDMHEPPE